MADYLLRVMIGLQDLQSLHVIINVEQCEFLRTKLTDTFLEVDRLIRPIRSLRPPGDRLGLILHQFLSSNLSKFVDIVARIIGGDGCSTSFALAIGEEILNVIKRAEWLVEECCNEHWLFKAMEVSATAEISEILRSLADLLPYAVSAELGIDPSQCDDQFLDTMKGLVSKLTEGIWGEEVEVELIKRSRSDRRVLLSKVEKMLGKLQVSEVAPDLATMGDNTGLAHLVRDRYTSVISSNWLPPELSGNINFDSLDVHGARVYTTLQCLGGKYSLLTLSLDCGGISDELIKNVCQEATLWKKYQHPYIVRLMGYWETNPRPYLLYEFMEFNLERLITKVRSVREIVPLEAIEMMLPVAKAIRYLHGHGVAHRSLNTENILCTVEQEDFSMPLHDVTLKLMGFGEALEGDLSSVQDRNWETASITEFTAPEILLQNNSSIDFMKADVFSFGVVLLKVLTGQTNFDLFALGGEGSPILQFRLESRGMERFKNSAGMLPASLGSIIESSCHADPSMRPTVEDICSRLRLCKLQLLSQKITDDDDDVGCVQAAKM